MKLLHSKIARRISALLVATGFLVVFALPASAATDCGILEKQFNTYGGNVNFTDNLPKFCTVAQLSQRVMNIAFALIGGVTVVFIIIGGYRYMVAGGSTEQATKGKQTLLYAVLGLVAVILAATIINIVVNLVVNNKVI